MHQSSSAQSIYEDGSYLESNPDWHAADAPYKARWIADILNRNGLSPATIVEVGSGSGEVLVNLQRHFRSAQLTGYDISPQAYAISKGKTTPSLSFYQGDYLALDTPGPDLLMAIDVFEHVPDYMGFLQRMRPRGEWKLFHIPLDLSVQGMLRGTGLAYARSVIGHLHYFCKDTALATLRDCGYEIVDWNYTHGAATLPNRRLRTRVLNVPRRLMRAANEDFCVRLLGGASMMVLTK